MVQVDMVKVEQWWPTNKIDKFVGGKKQQEQQTKFTGDVQMRVFGKRLLLAHWPSQSLVQCTYHAIFIS